jgi:hypothetical protein
MPPGNVFDSPAVVMTSPGAQCAPTPGEVGMSDRTVAGVGAAVILVSSVSGVVVASA